MCIIIWVVGQLRVSKINAIDAVIMHLRRQRKVRSDHSSDMLRSWVCPGFSLTVQPNQEE